MRNLIFVFALVFALFTSCNDDDGFTPIDDQTGTEQPVDTGNDEDDQQEEDDDNNDQEDDQEDEGGGDEEDNQDEDEDEDDQEDENDNNDPDASTSCFLTKFVKAGTGFEFVTGFERDNKGRVREIVQFSNGKLLQEVKINYSTNGTLRAMRMDASNGAQTNIHFDEKGRPVDGNTKLASGKVTTIHFALDNQDRIIKEIYRVEGKTVREMNYIFDGDNIAGEEGFLLRADGTKDIHKAKFQYETKGLNPYFFDQYVAHIALLENVSKNLRTAVINASGNKTLTIEYDLDNNLLPRAAKFDTAGGSFKAEYNTDCL